MIKKIAGVMLALAVATTCVFLGRWQLSRMEARQAWNSAVINNMKAPPVPAASLLRSPDANVEWRRVTFTGSFDQSHEILIRGRYFEGRYGYEVITPLRGAEDSLLVNRGWIPAGESATVAPEVPSPPQGQITVVGRVRLGDSKDRPGPSGSIIGLPVRAANRIDPEVLARDIPYPVLPAYIEMITPTPESPKVLPTPELSAGPHLAYAIQWFLFAGLALIAPFVYRRITPTTD